MTTQPKNADLAVGGNLSLTVAATSSNGKPVKYQWQKNGTDISGATAATYTKNSVVAADAGTYRVALSAERADILNSAAATVIVK
ncbi:immunoglobulin domain-containing protein [Serratia liquefaciens]|uniref:immunoglobulin domain-containing protein n=1 Tax=Serratia liquefaciens TaxID=614 RepID=UPI001F11C8C4|nr:immunoglobulin domain-containing protein [Serratia liquefaciens]